MQLASEPEDSPLSSELNSSSPLVPMDVLLAFVDGVQGVTMTAGRLTLEMTGVQNSSSLTDVPGTTEIDRGRGGRGGGPECRSGRIKE
jgi:hypothetical protein